jgi:Fe-S-cluster-containing hydrogenase component 2
MREVVEQRRIANSTVRQDHAHSEKLAIALDHGVLRGRQVLVRDPKLCQEGCRLCVDACTQRHGHARIQIDGVLLNGLDITNSCRQCRVGAECVEACPEDAIQWDQRGALIVTDACTGCGACVPACPYDAIDLVLQGNQKTSPLWGLWDRLQKLRNPVIQLESISPTQRANKCDLCHDYANLACVSACPTGALRLVPAEEAMGV